MITSEILFERLQRAFSPTHLRVVDDKDKHRGHAGEGAGHYTVYIQAPSFAGKSRVQIHRAIYQAVGDLMPTRIHALSIVLGSVDNSLIR